MTIHVFVGYDSREHAAWLVCRDSILEPLLGTRGEDVRVHPVSHRDLRRRGLFDRPWGLNDQGQTYDLRDGLTFSTEFSHSRFLVPLLAREMGVTSGPVVFVDCDFMFLSPIHEMLAGLNRNKVVSVVKHGHTRDMAPLKMDGQVQAPYFRKLWSSLMVYNMGHPDIDLFETLHRPNHDSGKTLHGFLELDDHEIGEIPDSWNYIPGFSHPLTPMPDAVHWSLGGPWMDGYERTEFAASWRRRYRELATELLNGNLNELFPLG